MNNNNNMDIKKKETCKIYIRLALRAERERIKKIFDLYKEDARNLNIEADELYEYLREAILEI